MITRQEYIEGAGGGKSGGSSGGYEAPDTLQTNSLLYLLHALVEGPVTGLATGDGQSIFINNTPLVSPNGVPNFNGASYVFRTGTADQDYIPGFANTTSVVTVSEEVLNTESVLYTVSSANVDAVTVTMELPNGLKQVNPKNGDVTGYSVEVVIDVQPYGANTWTNVYDVVKSGKSDDPFEWQIYVGRPDGAANSTWTIRVSRPTPGDNAYTTSSTTLDNVVEIQEVQLSYNTVCVCATAFNAQYFGTSIPTISFLLKGGSVQIPSNYTPSTGTYSGTWDGTFTTAYTTNPAWHLYDLLTNTQYGCGVYGVTADQIDKYSFYNASVFNDVEVPDGNGGYERRFTFNGVIQQSGDILSTALQLAGMMNGTLLFVNGLITLQQDRPTDPSFPITKYNVSNTGFTYVGTASQQRTTSVDMTWNDPNNNYQPTTVNEANTAAINLYGYNNQTLAAFGATTEGQARRAAAWVLYTDLNQTETVQFTMGLNGLGFSVGDVISVYDEDYANLAGSGKLVSATSNTVTLDQTVYANGGQISILFQDGQTYQTYNVVTSGSNTNVLTIDTTFANTPAQYCDYEYITTVEPRTFRVQDIKADESSSQAVQVTAILYDKGNYDFIEDGIVNPPGVYTNPNITTITQPQSINVIQTAVNVNFGESIQRGMLVSWTPPATGSTKYYRIVYRQANENWITIDNLYCLAYDIEPLLPGTYDIQVFAINVNGIVSPPANTTFTIDTSGGTGSALQPVTNLQVANNGTGNTFNSADLLISWTNPNGSNGNPTLMDFIVEVYDGSGDLKDYYDVEPVANGNTQYFLYTAAMNNADFAPADRNVAIQVYARDTNYLLSTATSNTFVNPAPSTVSGTLTTGANNIYLAMTAPSDQDFEGFIVWRDIVATVNTNASTLVYRGSANVFTDPNLVGGIEYYYRWAGYDTFSAANLTSLSLGSQLNISATNSITCETVGTNQISNNAVTIPAAAVAGSGAGTLTAGEWIAVVSSPAVAGDGSTPFLCSGVITNIYNLITSGSYELTAVIGVDTVPYSPGDVYSGGTYPPNYGGTVFCGMPANPSNNWMPPIPINYLYTPSSGIWYFTIFVQVNGSGSVPVTIYGNSELQVLGVKR